MNKRMLRFAVIIIATLLLAGCGTEDNNGQSTVTTNDPPEHEDTVLITISIDEGSEYVDEKEISVEEGDNLMEVLKQNFYVEEEGGFINSIERVSAEEGEEKGWIFYIDGEMAMVGAEDHQLSPGEEINFDFQPWE